jgi:hypothetical protein
VRRWGKLEDFTDSQVVGAVRHRHSPFEQKNRRSDFSAVS